MGLTRQELFSRLQLIRLMEPVTGEAIKAAEEHAYMTGSGNEPHGRPWHTSFHASSFPGDDEMACPRKALYTLMDTPNAKPFTPKSRFYMEIGRAVENVIVTGYYYQGILLSPPPWEEVQLGFEEPEIWLTGNADAVILHPKLGRPHLVEVKSKAAAVLEKMRVGLVGPDESHVRQAKCYVAFMHELSKKLWPKLEPVRDGSIYYVSRDDPTVSAEFFVDYDPAFKEEGIAKLKQWKEWFENDVLPSHLNVEMEVPKGRLRHPMGWRWTYPPCQWCDYGQVCRKDHKDEVTELSNSHAIGFSREISESYNYDKVRAAVFAAWEEA